MKSCGLAVALALVCGLGGTPTLAQAAASSSPASSASASSAPASSAPAASAAPTPASPQPPAAVKPAPPPTPPIYPWWGILLGVVAVAVLSTVVALYPVIYYVTRGWAWRADMISNSLTKAAKDRYLSLYHQQPSDVAKADTRFTAFYREWYGRTRLVAPAAVVAIITFIYALVMALAGAQGLWPTMTTAWLPIVAHPIALGAIAGAYTLISLDSIGRVAQRDLSPEDLYLQALRLAAAVPIGYAFYVLNPATAPFLGFAVAAFPLQQIGDMLRQQAASKLGSTLPPDVVADVLTRLSGVDTPTADRIQSIGINTITQLANSDPIQLTMRTNLSFSFVLDLTSQALAWVYLEGKLDTLRPIGLRGACELAVLERERKNVKSRMHANAVLVVGQLAAALASPGAPTLTNEQMLNVLHQIAEDNRTKFLLLAAQ